MSIGSLPTYPNIPDLIRAAADLRYPSNASEDFMLDALVRVVRNMTDDEKGDAISAVAHMVLGNQRARVGSLNVDGWGVDRARVLTALRDCRTPSDGYEFVAAMNHTAPVNENWSVTSGFLQLVNPEIFPAWNQDIAAKFDVLGYDAINSKGRFEAFCAFVWEAASTYGIDAAEAVGRHVNSRRSQVQSIAILLSWPGTHVAGQVR